MGSTVHYDIAAFEDQVPIEFEAFGRNAIGVADATSAWTSTTGKTTASTGTKIAARDSHVDRATKEIAVAVAADAFATCSRASEAYCAVGHLHKVFAFDAGGLKCVTTADCSRTCHIDRDRSSHEMHIVVGNDA